MFNLDQAIANWRRQMAAVGIKSTGVLDELESHLRDDIEAQVHSGVEEELAFKLAVRRLGAARGLRREFAKSAEPKGAKNRLFLKCFYFLSATVAVLINLWTLVSFELSPAERRGAACIMAVFALYLFGLPFAPWWRRGASRTWLLGLMKALGFITLLWTLWALLTAFGIGHGELGLLPNMIMWSLCAAYGLTALAWGLNEGFGDRGGCGGPFPPPDPFPRPVPPNQPCPPEVKDLVPPSAPFSTTARCALEMAREEAMALGHDFIGTEHVLLGVLKTAGAALAQTLRRNQVSSKAVRAEVNRLISVSPARPATTAPPLTRRTRKALQLAGREAGALKHPSIGAEHILLGLLLEGSGVAAIALRNLGIRVDRLRNEFSRY